MENKEGLIFHKAVWFLPHVNILFNPDVITRRNSRTHGYNVTQFSNVLAQETVFFQKWAWTMLPHLLRTVGMEPRYYCFPKHCWI